VLPVLVGSHPESPWIEDCLKSIRTTTDRPITVHTIGGHEPFALRTGLQWGRFLFLQDSCRILDAAFWEVVDSSGPSFLFGRPAMFLGIYDSQHLRPLLPTEPVDKETSIRLEVELADSLGYPSIWPDVLDRTALRREHRNGRDNLVLGNELIEKHKGTWR